MQGRGRAPPSTRRGADQALSTSGSCSSMPGSCCQVDARAAPNAFRAERAREGGTFRSPTLSGWRPATPRRRTGGRHPASAPPTRQTTSVLEGRSLLLLPSLPSLLSPVFSLKAIWKRFDDGPDDLRLVNGVGQVRDWFRLLAGQVEGQISSAAFRTVRRSLSGRRRCPRKNQTTASRGRFGFPIDRAAQGGRNDFRFSTAGFGGPSARRPEEERCRGGRCRRGWAWQQPACYHNPC
jgi:hypothetical protein